MNGGETILVRRAQAGDRAAFDLLAGRYRAALRALAFMRTSDLGEADDLVQEILTRAWQGLPGLQNPSAFLAWLKTIAARACQSWYRRSRPWPESLTRADGDAALPDPGPTPLEALLAQEKQRALRQALAGLPAANRIALLMHVWGGYCYDEIAAFTDVPVTTVEGRIYRAKKQMRVLLRDSGAEFLREPRRPKPAPISKGENP